MRGGAGFRHSPHGRWEMESEGPALSLGSQSNNAVCHQLPGFAVRAGKNSPRQLWGGTIERRVSSLEEYPRERFELSNGP